MFFDLLHALATQSPFGLPLNELVYEIPRILAPTLRQLFLRNLNLFAQNLISDLLSVSSVIRPPSQHALVADDSQRVVIHLIRVLHATHHLGSHVARRSGGFFPIVRISLPRDAEICEFQVAAFIEDQIFGFQISVNVVLLMDVVQRKNDAGSKETSLSFTEFSLKTEVKSEISPSQQIQGKIEMPSILESVLHVHDKRVVEFR